MVTRDLVPYFRFPTPVSRFGGELATIFCFSTTFTAASLRPSGAGPVATRNRGFIQFMD